jgi:hypothetical protein
MRYPNPAAQAFLRTLWKPGSDGADDPGKAFASGEMGRAIAALQAGRASGSATPEEARLLWRALLEADRFAEALEVLDGPDQAQAPAPDHALGRAVALAGLGRLSEAMGAVAAIPEAERGEAAEALEQQLQDAAAGGLKGVWGWLLLGAYEPAAETMMQAVDVIPAVDRAEARTLLCQILEHVSAQTADRLIERCASILSAGDGEPHLNAEHCRALAEAAHGRWTQASDRLGPPAAQVAHAQPARRALARCVGAALIDQLKPRFLPRPGRRVVDVFPFFDELMVLELRLQEMAPWVDKFVILEADQTFTGQPKPLHFHAHRERFARWADKIVHVPVRFPPWVSSHWTREFYQRDAGLAVLGELCGPDDLVLLTDVDEIIDRKAVESFEGPFATLHMDTYAFWFNVRHIEEKPVPRGAIWRAGLLDRFGMSYARLVPAGLFKRRRIHKAGWHFTSIRQAQDLPTKFRSYSHIQHAGRDEAHYGKLLERIRAGVAPGYQRVELDGSFPAALHREAERLADFILQAPA